MTPQYLRASLEKGHCLLLFDALDEVSSHPDRERIVAAIDAFMTRFPKNRCVIATRPYAYRDRAALAGDVFVGHLSEFSTNDVTAFLDAWYDSVKVTLDSPLDRQNAEQRREDLKQAATSNESISALTKNPLMLANIAIIHYNQRKLPERRAELYDLCTELMFGLWDQHRRLDITKGLEDALPGLDAKARREFFEGIAFWFHQQEQRDFAAEPTDVRAQLRSQLQERLGVGADLPAKAQQLLDTIIQRSGLFQERGDSTLQFVHHTFQEYLTARHITFRDDFTEFAVGRLGDSWWEEVIRLAAGHLSTEHNKFARLRLGELIEGIVGATGTPDELIRNCLFAGRCLMDVGPMSVHASLRAQTVQNLQTLADDPNYVTFHEALKSVLSQLNP